MWTALALLATAFLLWFAFDTARLNYLWEADDHAEQSPRCTEGPRITVVGDRRQDPSRYERTLAPRPGWRWPGSLVFDWEDDPELAVDDIEQWER
jgi:hypothetical protein